MIVRDEEPQQGKYPVRPLASPPSWLLIVLLSATVGACGARDDLPALESKSAGSGGDGGGTAIAGQTGFPGEGATGGSGFSCDRCSEITLAPCREVRCDPERAQCVELTQADGTACAQGDLCAVGTCHGGDCVPTPKDCSATTLPGECFAAVCNAMTGACEAQPTTGPPCAGEPCTEGGTCQNGVCSGGTPKDCSALDSTCTQGVCDPLGGECVVAALAPGTDCDDQEPCTRADSCLNGICGGTVVTTCTDADQCCPAGCNGGNDDDCTEVIVLDAVNRGWWSFGPAHAKQENYYGGDPSETASVWDVSTSSSALAASGVGPSIADDLQSGNSYGSFTGSPAQTGAVHTVALNAQAVADANLALGGSFSVGVHIDTLAGAPFTDEGLRFGESQEARVHQLVLHVE